METRVSIVIAVYNEASTLHQLLDLVWNQPLPGLGKELIIVESNSKDGSRQIVEEFAQQKNALKSNSVKVILQERAQGKGNAVRQGLEAVTGDIVLIQDGDLEYDVKDYPALLEPILENRADFVLGSRHLSAAKWKIRNFGKNRLRSRFMNFGGLLFHGLFNFVYGTKLTDPTTMYKVFRRTCLNDFDLVSNRFDFDFELLGKLIRSGHPPIEVPVAYTSRGFEEGKKVRIFRDPLTWVWAIFKFRICSLQAEKLKDLNALKPSVLPEPND